MSPYLSLPDAIGRPDLPQDRRPRLITPVWGPPPPSFSQITWHFAKAAIRKDTLETAFVLQSRSNFALQVSGALWKSWQRLRQRKYGGYKFSRSFSDLLRGRYRPRLADTVIISDLQVFGELILPRYAALMLEDMAPPYRPPEGCLAITEHPLNELDDRPWYGG